MLDTVKINHVQHISFTQSRLTDAVSVILSELLSYEHPSNSGGFFVQAGMFCSPFPEVEIKNRQDWRTYRKASLKTPNPLSKIIPVRSQTVRLLFSGSVPQLVVL